MLQITPGVQGLPCLLTPMQGKPCTPASLLIAPLGVKLSVVDVKAKDRAEEGCFINRVGSENANDAPRSSAHPTLLSFIQVKWE